MSETSTKDIGGEPMTISVIVPCFGVAEDSDDMRAQARSAAARECAQKGRHIVGEAKFIGDEKYQGIPVLHFDFDTLPGDARP